MRKHVVSSKIVVFLAVMLLGISCSKEKDSIKRSDLIGVWTISSVNYSITVNGEDIVKYLEDLLNISETQAEVYKDFYTNEFDGTIEFKEDETYIVRSESGNDSGKWALSSDGQTIIFDENTLFETTIDVDSYKPKSDELSISMTDTYDEDFNHDGTEETKIVSKTSLTLTK